MESASCHSLLSFASEVTEICVLMEHVCWCDVPVCNVFKSAAHVSKLWKLHGHVKNILKRILQTKVSLSFPIGTERHFKGMNECQRKAFQAYNSNKYQRTGHELASKTIPQRDVVFDNPMSVFFFQIHLFDWHSKCHHFETQVSHNWNMSAHPACMHLYEHIICPCIFLMSRFLLVNLGYCDGARIWGLLWRGVMDQ